MQVIPPTDTAPYVPDPRFRALLGERCWARLPAAVHARFGKRLRRGMSVTYQGEVTTMRLSRAGRLLAHVLRPLGAPLPYDTTSVGQAAVVVVTEDAGAEGQFARSAGSGHRS